MGTKLQKFLRSYVEGVYTMQNGAYERNGLQHILWVAIRGGVEDTRLESTAKDSQPFRGQILSRPKTKNTGASVLKEKVFCKFSARFLAFSYIILKMNKSLLL